MSDENEKRVYKLLITKGIDPDDQYGFYKERIDSQNDFSYIEYNTSENDLTDDLFNQTAINELPDDIVNFKITIVGAITSIMKKSSIFVKNLK